ncbi:MAG: CinA family nicotinamide mononucleotide deamidase-related protein [Pirellulaceae bacterium]|nr:CinA family nicotinamide mononucleotide deamidase-related protein [Pirellulaceae bacterium]
MRAEIISIGDELTSGQRLDTNSQWLAERLGDLGVTVMFHSTVADDLAANVLVFRQACERADLVIASGGLGPTADDLTRQAIADMAGVDLVQDDASLAHIQAMFARRKREMPSSNNIQAMFPRGARPIHNPHGTAPGIDFTLVRPGLESARIFALPGVPAEMKEMWQESVRPEIQKLQETRGAPKVIVHHRIKCFGVGESDLEGMLPDLIRRGRSPSVGITVSQATITLRITAEGENDQAARAAMKPTIKTIRKCLGDVIYGEEDDELQHVVIRRLRERKLTLAVCECGTGGLISNWLSECDPAGEVFKLGTVLRSPDTAATLLGLPSELTLGDQPQSPDFAAALAAHVRSLAKTDLAISLGPFPQADSPTTIPGEVHFALARPAGILVKSSAFAGHPEILKPRAAKQALNLLRLEL